MIVAMAHTHDSEQKTVTELSPRMTSKCRLTLIITEMAVIEPTDEGLILKEIARGIAVEQLRRRGGRTSGRRESDDRHLDSEPASGPSAN